MWWLQPGMKLWMAKFAPGQSLPGFDTLNRACWQKVGWQVYDDGHTEHSEGGTDITKTAADDRGKGQSSVAMHEGWLKRTSSRERRSPGGERAADRLGQRSAEAWDWGTARESAAWG